MIDHRFSLTQDTQHKHLIRVEFDVVMPEEQYCYHHDDLVLAVCRKEFPELVFSYTGCYQARFADGQYATAVMQIVGKYLVKLHFSITLALDTIMKECLSFKQHVPPLEYVVDPIDLINMPPDDFYEGVENLYSVKHKISLRIKAVSWQFLHMDGDNPVYKITPTDYDFI